MGYKLVGASSFWGAGFSVDFGGDYDGDGIADLLIGSGDLNPDIYADMEPSGAYLINGTRFHALDGLDGTYDGQISLGLVHASMLSPITEGAFTFTTDQAETFPSPIDGEAKVLWGTFGTAVSWAGDVDGDGLDDLIMGYKDDPARNETWYQYFQDAGTSYLVTGKSLTISRHANLNLDRLAEGEGVYSFYGSAAGDMSGYSVSTAGDIDGDGLDDFLIGAPGVDLVNAYGDPYELAGKTYLVLSGNLSMLDSLDGQMDWRIPLWAVDDGGYEIGGAAVGDATGKALLGGKDFDGDGLPDIVISATGGGWSNSDGGTSAEGSIESYGPIDQGELYLLSSRILNDLLSHTASVAESPDNILSLALATDFYGAVNFIGVTDYEGAGKSLGWAGDVDGDGLEDLLVGAPDYKDTARTQHGKAYLRFSSTSLNSGERQQALYTGDAGGYAFISNVKNDQVGTSLSTAGDVDGDGLADILIGANANSYLVMASSLHDLDLADGEWDGIIKLENVHLYGGYQFTAGFSVEGGFDIDGDGRSDIAVGMPYQEPRPSNGSAPYGAVYILASSDFEYVDSLDGTIDNILDVENFDFAPLCFVRGTRIITDQGEVPVEDIRPGDRVLTMDNGYRPVCWIGSSRRQARGKMAPVRIARGALGNHRDLWVSPQHRMLIRRADGGEAFAAAIHLVDGSAITQVAGGIVEYFHLMCDRHQVLFAEGIPAESFFPGPEAWKSLSADGREELLSLFPELAPETCEKLPGRPGPGPVPGYGALARAVLRRRDLPGLPRREATPA